MSSTIEHVEVWGGRAIEVHHVRDGERHLIGFLASRHDPLAEIDFLASFGPAKRRWRQRAMSQSIGGTVVKLGPDAEAISLALG